MSDMKEAVALSNVYFSYGTQTVAQNAGLSLPLGDRIALMGPSGCGKSTLLRLIAGLAKPASGNIRLHGSLAGKTGMRLLFQDYDAFPWLTARENVRQGSGPSPCPADDKVDGMLEAVGLAGSADRFPAELSGGMRKRLALARALIRRPILLVMDEPFSSLDVDTKYEMYRLVQRFWDQDETSVLLVTHDPQEAALLCNRVIVFNCQGLGVKDEVKVPSESECTPETMGRVVEQIVAAIQDRRPQRRGRY